MRLFRREDEGGFTVADWDDGFAGLNRTNGRTRVFDFQLERWPCCPGSIQLNLELFGFLFVLYNEGGPCQMEAYSDDEEAATYELAPPVQLATPPTGSDWTSMPAPAGR